MKRMLIILVAIIGFSATVIADGNDIPATFLPDHPGWRAQEIRKVKMTVGYTNTPILSIIQNLNGINTGLIDGAYRGPGLRRRINFSVTNATIREILWKLSKQTGMTIRLATEFNHGRSCSFLAEVPNEDGSFAYTNAVLSPSGKTGLSDDSKVVMLRFQKALRSGQWPAALSLCSTNVRAKATEYGTVESFFKTVLPLQQFVDLQDFPVCGSKYKGGIDGEPINFRCFLRRSVDWVWSIDKTDNGWLVDFQTEPLAVWEKAKKIEEARRWKKEWDARQKDLDAKVANVGTRLTSAVGTQFVQGAFMPLRLELVNHGSTVLWYDDQQVGVNSSLTVADSEGHPVPYDGGSFQTVGAFRPIQPGQSVVLFDNFDLNRQYPVRRAGDYSVQFSGKGLALGDKIDGDPPDARPTCSTNRFPSNVLRIRVN
ncbi:MAG: hypothetical protein L6437_00060 [Kiritimatiellae bacterium]|nr:hypothetical protein [Kiritimatiellia bacterium]